MTNFDFLMSFTNTLTSCEVVGNTVNFVCSLDFHHGRKRIVVVHGRFPVKKDWRAVTIDRVCRAKEVFVIDFDSIPRGFLMTLGNACTQSCRSKVENHLNKELA